MATAFGDTDACLARFSDHPSGDGMIRVSPIGSRQLIPPRKSSLGGFDHLPTEIMQIILLQLDLRSLVRFSRVSSVTRFSVASLPQYRDMPHQIPEALAALGRTGLATGHTAQTLYMALHSNLCASCGQFGPYLFLPTCERCCFECLRRNPALWVIPKSLACKVFTLTQPQIKRLLRLRLIPGRYYVNIVKRHRRRQHLVSVKAAKQLASNSGWSEPSPQETPATATWSDRAITKYYQEQKLQGACLDSIFTSDPALLPMRPNDVEDDYNGTASILFPSLTITGKLDHGQLCRGCARLYKNYKFRRITDSEIPDLPTSRVFPENFLLARMRRAWSKSDFRLHARECQGVSLYGESTLSAA